MVTTSSSSKTYFSPTTPTSPFAPPGVYITPTGPVSYGGGSAVKTGGGSSGGGGHPNAAGGYGSGGIPTSNTSNTVTTSTIPSSSQQNQDKLRIGSSVVSKYQPFTKAEQEKVLALKAGNKILSNIDKTSNKANFFSSAGKVVTTPRDILVEALSGTGKHNQEYKVPTDIEFFNKQIMSNSAYYTRPTYTGKLNLAGATLVSPPTPGEKLYTNIQQENIVAQIKADSSAKNIISENIDKAKIEANILQSELQARANSGENINKLNDELQLGIKNIQNKYQIKSESQISSKVKEIESITKRNQEKLISDYSKAAELALGSKLFSAGLTGASWGIPVYGQALKVADISQMVGNLPSFGQSLVANPVYTLKEAGIGIAGGMVGYGIVNGIKNSISNANLKSSALEQQRKLKLSTSHSLSVSDAVKVGLTVNGESIWEVKINSVSEIINKKTGKVVDTVKSVSTATSIISPTESGAIKSVVEAVSLDLRKGGIRNYKEGNKITIKSGLSRTSGSMVFEPTLNEDIFKGTGNFAIKSGNQRTKITPNLITTKGNIENLPSKSALSNILSIRKETYPEVKLLKNNFKVKGTESIYESFIATDIYKDLINVKGYKYLRFEKGFPTTIKEIKVDKYLRNIGKESKGFRDITKSYQKSFVPENLELDFSETEFTKPNIPKVKLINLSEKTVAELSSKAAVSARLSEVTNKLVGNIKNSPVKVKTIKYNPQNLFVPGLTRGIVEVKKSSKYDVKDWTDIYVSKDWGKDIYSPSVSEIKSPSRDRLIYAPESEMRKRGKEWEGLVYNPISNFENRDSNKIKDRFNEVIISRSNQKQQQIKLQKQQLRTINLTVPGFNKYDFNFNPKPIKFPPIPPIFTNENKDLNNLFIGEIRRRGKWFAVTKPTDYRIAVKKAREKILSGLGASFRLRRTTGGFAKVPFDKIFTSSKRSPMIAVQKRTYRLSSLGERAEIQAARKSAPKRHDYKKGLKKALSLI